MHLQNQQVIYPHQARRMSAGSPVFLKRHLIPINVKGRELVDGLGALPVHCLSTLEWKTPKGEYMSAIHWRDTGLLWAKFRKYDKARKMNEISVRKSEQFTSVPHPQCTLVRLIHTKTLIVHLLMIDYRIHILSLFTFQPIKLLIS